MLPCTVWVDNEGKTVIFSTKYLMRMDNLLGIKQTAVFPIDIH